MHSSYNLYGVGTREIGRQLDSIEMSPFFGTRQMSNSAQFLTGASSRPANRSTIALYNRIWMVSGRKRRIVPARCPDSWHVGFDQLQGLLEFPEAQIPRSASTLDSRAHSPSPDQPRGLGFLHTVTAKFSAEVFVNETSPATSILDRVALTVPEGTGQALVDNFAAEADVPLSSSTLQPAVFVSEPCRKSTMHEAATYQGSSC